MAMVKISNGEVTQIVSRGAYENQYKKLGFSIVGSTSKSNNKSVVTNPIVDTNTDVGVNEDFEDTDVASDEDDFEELLEKPLSQWSNEELKTFVNAKGIDTSSAKKASDVRGLIKKYLDNEAKRNA